MTISRPALGAVGIVAASALLLTACGGDGDGTAPTPTESLEVTTSETPVVEPQDSEPVEAESLRGATVDPGLNVEMTYQGVASGTYGGSVVTVKVRNLNEEPLPADAIGQAVLRYNSGGGSMTDAEPVSSDNTDVVVGLDLPLGSQATVNLQYPFAVSPGNLWDAELKVGNVVWDGNLNF